MADQVEEVKTKTDIVSLIAEHVDLKKAGRNFKGMCPFHDEKTPSFMVSPELQIYKCFGCGESGDVIAFLQKYEGMEFTEALAFLAERAGVKLKTFRGEKKGEKEKLYQVNQLTLRFYNYLLTKHPVGQPALDYLTKKRLLKLNTIEKFQIGYSPTKSLALEKYMSDKKKIPLGDLQNAGLVYLRSGHGIDRFKGRVVFPLYDHRGNPVGFSGRTLPWDKGDKAKYINTPETKIYHKSSVLYGLNAVKDDIKKKKAVVIVEGELDMISSWQVGMTNTVAIKGSALTEEQARLLSRYVKNITLALDTDIAGDMAARRGIKIAEKQGFDIKVAVLKKYKDPDEAAREDPGSLKTSIKNAVGVWDYMVETIISHYDVKTGSGKAKISKEIVPVLRSIENRIVQAHYIKVVARRLGISVEAVSDEVGRLGGGSKPMVKEEVIRKEGKKGRRELLEGRILSIVFLIGPKILKKKEINALFQTPLAKRIVDYYLKSYSNIKSKKEFSAKKFAQTLPSELVSGFHDMVLKSDFEGDNGREDRLRLELNSLITETKIYDVKSKLEEVAKDVMMYEKKKNRKKLDSAKRRFKALTQTLTELEDIEDKGIILEKRK